MRTTEVRVIVKPTCDHCKSSFEDVVAVTEEQAEHILQSRGWVFKSYGPDAQSYDRCPECSKKLEQKRAQDNATALRESVKKVVQNSEF